MTTLLPPSSPRAVTSRLNDGEPLGRIASVAGNAARLPIVKLSTDWPPCSGVTWISMRFSADGTGEIGVDAHHQRRAVVLSGCTPADSASTTRPGT